MPNGRCQDPQLARLYCRNAYRSMRQGDAVSRNPDECLGNPLLCDMSSTYLEIEAMSGTIPPAEWWVQIRLRHINLACSSLPIFHGSCLFGGRGTEFHMKCALGGTIRRVSSFTATLHLEVLTATGFSNALAARHLCASLVGT